MTIYNPVRDTSPANPVIAADTANYVFGYYFTVSAACQINGVWWFCDVANNQYTNSAGDEQIALWTVTGAGGAGENYISGTAVTAGTYSQGWNFISYASPLSLTAGVEYLAVKGIAPHAHGSINGYCITDGFFKSGGAGAAGFTDGPVTTFSSGNVSDGTGTAHLEPFGNGQMQFFTISGSTTPDVTANAPNAVFHATWYGLDVQIQTPSATAPFLAPMRLT